MSYQIANWLCTLQITMQKVVADRDKRKLVNALIG